MMMAANLVGFVIGTEGIVYLAGELFGTLQGGLIRYNLSGSILTVLKGIKFIVAASFAIFIGVQLMFEYRYNAPDIRPMLSNHRL